MKPSQEQLYRADIVVTKSGVVLKSRFTRPQDLKIVVVSD